MIGLLLEELGRAGQGFELYHVNLKLSSDNADVGRWRLGKFFSLLRICFQVLYTRWKHGPMTLYYIPAPAKRGALYRDWVIMALCRSFFPKLILHWHAVGLGHWIENTASNLERSITKKLLGQADLSIVLAEELAEDVMPFLPKRIAIVQNSLTDSGVLPPARHRDPEARFEILYIGLCSEEKGTFDTLEAMHLLHAHSPGSYRLTIAGAFESPEAEKKFQKRAAELRSAVRFVGFADPAEKLQLFLKSDVFCFPTYYRHEGQPLVLIEALAHDIPIVTTQWRAIPSMLPRKHVWYVEPRKPDQIAEAIFKAKRFGQPGGALREHYLLNYTPAQHIGALKKALQSVEA